MRKIISILVIIAFTISLFGCAFPDVMSVESTTSTQNAKLFYDKVCECKEIIDFVATDVCAAWKDAVFDYNLTTKDINAAIENAKDAHSENIGKINELDKEIIVLFDGASEDNMGISAEYALKQVMKAYAEYKDAVLYANEALDSRGYHSISVSKEALDRALRDLFVEL